MGLPTYFAIVMPKQHPWPSDPVEAYRLLYRYKRDKEGMSMVWSSPGKPPEGFGSPFVVHGSKPPVPPMDLQEGLNLPMLDIDEQSHWQFPINLEADRLLLEGDAMMAMNDDDNPQHETEEEKVEESSLSASTSISDDNISIPFSQVPGILDRCQRMPYGTRPIILQFYHNRQGVLHAQLKTKRSSTLKTKLKI
jgi:hypothetical protein